MVTIPKAKICPLETFYTYTRFYVCIYKQEDLLVLLLFQVLPHPIAILLFFFFLFLFFLTASSSFRKCICHLLLLCCTSIIHLFKTLLFSDPVSKLPTFRHTTLYTETYLYFLFRQNSLVCASDTPS